jgi:hypothetical protein
VEASGLSVQGAGAFIAPVLEVHLEIGMHLLRDRALAPLLAGAHQPGAAQSTQGELSNNRHGSLCPALSSWLSSSEWLWTALLGQGVEQLPCAPWLAQLPLAWQRLQVAAVETASWGAPAAIVGADFFFFDGGAGFFFGGGFAASSSSSSEALSLNSLPLSHSSQRRVVPPRLAL